jgi:hypothetical protein
MQSAAQLQIGLKHKKIRFFCFPFGFQKGKPKDKKKRARAG